MSAFNVDPSTLRVLRDTIAVLYIELSGMGQRTPAFHKAIGGGSLETEVDNFLSAWRGGVKVIAGDMEKISQKLYTAAENYAASDGYVGSACVAGASPALFRSTP